MDIIEFYNTYIIEIITTICIVFFLFWWKIRAKVAPKLWKSGYYKLTKKDLAYWNLYKNMSALWYAAKNDTLDKELQNLKNYFLDNKQYFSEETREIYHQIFDRFYSFEAWNWDSDKMKKISEENFINMDRLKHLIISETNYTQYMFDNSIKWHY